MLDSHEIYERILSLYETSGMTATRLSEKSGVPLTSLNRFLSGETKSPNFYSLCSVILALGGSVDDILGADHMSQMSTYYGQTESKYVAQLKEDLAMERKAKRTWIVIFLLLGLFFLCFLIFDLFNPSIGFITYGK